MRPEAPGRSASSCASCRAGRRSGPVLLRKTASAYAVVRAVRLLQARGVVPGHGGLRLGGVHLHHHLWGALLVLASPHLTGRSDCLHRPLRANVLCTGLALVLDELDVLTGIERRPAARPVRAVLDVAGAVAAADGLRYWRSTWSGWHPGPDGRVRADHGRTRARSE